MSRHLARSALRQRRFDGCSRYVLPTSAVSTPAGGDQTERTRSLDRLVAAVRVELVVDVAQVGPDGVHRQVELPGDLRHGQAGGQVAQDAALRLAERLAHLLARICRS